jgi:hypothetical protein
VCSLPDAAAFQCIQLLNTDFALGMLPLGFIEQIEALIKQLPSSE